MISWAVMSPNDLQAWPNVLVQIQLEFQASRWYFEVSSHSKVRAHESRTRGRRFTILQQKSHRRVIVPLSKMNLSDSKAPVTNIRLPYVKEAHPQVVSCSSDPGSVRMGGSSTISSNASSPDGEESGHAR